MNWERTVRPKMTDQDGYTREDPRPEPPYKTRVTTYRCAACIDARERWGLPRCVFHEEQKP